MLFVLPAKLAVCSPGWVMYVKNEIENLCARNYLYLDMISSSRMSATFFFLTKMCVKGGISRGFDPGKSTHAHSAWVKFVTVR